ncbi:alpha/beta fold hydrolase [Mariniblastus sp.]|nr:alpha/beta fold hydrolase [Mariniblastus sp.]
MAVGLVCLMLPALGCRSFQSKLSSQRLEHGYTIVLPGILGEQGWDRNVADTIRNSSYPGEVEIYDWTHGPLLFGWNMFDSRQVKQISSRITNYQERYPGRPVYLIGHSGGCKIAVQTLESMPTGRRIEKAVLLAPGMSSHYDLRQAMSHTRSGISAFSSALDVPISVPLTGFRGLADGELRLPAAAFGFHPPKGLSTEEARRYEQLLDQRRYSGQMLGTGHLGGHFGWTSPSFIAEHVVPQILSPSQQAPHHTASGAKGL